ncbi:CCGSCS motif protein [Shewanella sp. OPT22]|nr:CCGSCS motif protein [Shewanella sp. OPT22]
MTIEQQEKNAEELAKQTEAQAAEQTEAKEEKKESPSFCCGSCS